MDLDIPEAGSQNPINWPDPSSKPMSDYFWDKLRNICPYCECKGGILWRNLHRADPHFDACFRYFEGKPVHPAEPVKTKSHRRCFLKRESTFKKFRSAPDDHSLYSQGPISSLSTRCVILGSPCQGRRQRIHPCKTRKCQSRAHFWIHSWIYQRRHGTNSHRSFHPVAGYHGRP